MRSQHSSDSGLHLLQPIRWDNCFSLALCRRYHGQPLHALL